MSYSGDLASFCRLCLSRNKDMVPVFDDESTMENLLYLIEIQIDPDEEPGAVVCVDCIVTLEGFLQFKDQCHVNAELVKTICTVDETAIEVLEEEPIERVDILEGEIDEEETLEFAEHDETHPRDKKSFADKFQEFAAKTLGTAHESTLPAGNGEDFSSSRSKRKAKSSPRYEDDYVEPKKRKSASKLDENHYTVTYENDASDGDSIVENSSDIDQLQEEYSANKNRRRTDLEDSTEHEDSRSDNLNVSMAEQDYGEYVEELADEKSSLDNDSDKDEEISIHQSNRESYRKSKFHGTKEDDIEKIDEQCKSLNIRTRGPMGPSLDEQLVLADSYPDYFYFEKLPRSSYFSLVYYGERFHSAVFTEYYTYWSCPQRRKEQCPAQVRVSNDYKRFERRYEHTHPDIKGRQGEAFTPKEALPQLFELCRKMVLRYRAKQRLKLLQRHMSSKKARRRISDKRNSRSENTAEQNPQDDDESDMELIAED